MSYGEYTETELTAIKDKERLGNLDDFNWDISGQSENVGRMGTNAGTGGIITAERRQKKKEEELRAALDQVQRLKELQDTIDNANKGIDAGNNLLGVMRSGEFDRENDQHITWIIALGLDPNDPDLDEAAVRERMQELEEIKAGAENERRSIMSDNSLSAEQKTVAQKEAVEVSHDASLEQIDMSMDLDAFLDDGMVSFASEVNESPIQTAEALSDTFGRAKDRAEPYEEAPALENTGLSISLSQSL